MKKITIVSLLSFLFITMQSFIANPPKNFYDLTIKSIDGKETIEFSKFKGKKILMVNTASECGYTPQYADLQAISEKYGDKLVVIGFPCNQFGSQEPGTSDEISYFCKRRYSVTFPITEKIDVKGDNQHPVYTWLTQKKFNGKEDVTVRWNFGKFLIDEKGKYMAYFPSQVRPIDKQITDMIEGSGK